MLGDDDFGYVLGIYLVGVALLPFLFVEVEVVTVDEHDDVGILLDAAAFAQVRKLGAVGLAGFGGPAELGDGEDRDVEVAGHSLGGAGYFAHLLNAVFTPGAALNQLEIVDDERSRPRSQRGGGTCCAFP